MAFFRLQQVFNEMSLGYLVVILRHNLLTFTLSHKGGDYFGVIMILVIYDLGFFISPGYL